MDKEREKDRQANRKVRLVSLDEPTRRHPGETYDSDEDRGLKVPDSRPGPYEEAEEGDTRQMIQEAMTHLTQLQGAVIRLVLLEGHTVREAGRILGIKSAHVHYERGKQRLREFIKRPIK